MNSSYELVGITSSSFEVMQSGKRVICSEIGILIQIDFSAGKKKTLKTGLNWKQKKDEGKHMIIRTWRELWQ